MSTFEIPLEESNLAGVGSDEDKACREAAAKIEMKWEGAGESVGIQIWRVENKRNENDVGVFGINQWPEEDYGKFYRGDSYIVLQTREDEEGERYWDIYFWIGSESSQDEYGVAAYKANELDDLLGDEPMQHREVEQRESRDFIAMFPKGIEYLEGGIASGFRNVGADSNEESLDERTPDRLFCIHKVNGVTRSVQVPMKRESLNQGDAFLLDTGASIYTWFGSTVNPFEKNKAAVMARNMATNLHGHAQVFPDVGDDNDEFWELLGGRGDIKEGVENAPPEPMGTRMYVLSDEGGKVAVTKLEPVMASLDTNNVCLIDRGEVLIIWVGKEASKAEKQQSLRLVDQQLRTLGRKDTTTVYKIKEGQEKRCNEFKASFE